MGASRTVHFGPRSFPAGEARRAIERLKDSLFPDHVIRLSRYSALRDGTTKWEHDLALEALDDSCDTSDLARHIIAIRKERGGIGLLHEVAAIKMIAHDDGYLEADVEAQTVADLNAVAESFEQELKLERAPSPEKRIRDRVRQEFERSGQKPLDTQLQELSERLRKVEQALATERAYLTCFLSFQFSGASVEYGRVVKEFLECQRVRVITGQGYEPKPVSEKVKGRLAEALDVVVVIEPADRKSAWTRDEMARAQSPGVHLIPLVEEGATFDRGIYGDHEYIPFAAGHVGDALLGLLQGIQYVQRVKAADATK